MIGGERFVRATTMSERVPVNQLAWDVYVYLEGRPDCDPILEKAAAVCLALGEERPYLTDVKVKPILSRR